MKIDQQHEKTDIRKETELICLLAKGLFHTKDNYKMNEQINDIRKCIDFLVVTLNRLESTIETEETK